MNTSLFTGNYQLARTVRLALASDMSIGLYGDEKEIGRIKTGLSKIVEVKPFPLSDLHLKISPVSAETILGKDNMDYDFLEQKKVAPVIFCDERQSSGAKAMLKRAIEIMGFSVSDVEIIIKIATFCAAIDKSHDVNIEHIAEAIQYRAGRNDIENAKQQTEDERLRRAYEAGKNGIEFEVILKQLTVK